MTFPVYFDIETQSTYSHVGNYLVSGNSKIPITNGIPRFVKKDNYASAFGEQWKRYRLTQLDSHTGQPISEDRLKRCLGKAYHQLSGKMVLEAGCGAGRFTEVLLKKQASVVSIDLSHAVDANKNNFPINDAHIIAQADITQLPFRKEQFDIVVCLGVIQHTVNPEITIKGLYDQVKKGGYLAIDHYTHTISYYTKATALFRFFLKRIGPINGLKSTEWLVKYMYPLHKAVRNHRVLQAMLSRISPARSYFQSHPQLNDKIQYEWMLLDTHDSLTDYYKHFRTVGQIKKLLEKMGAADIQCNYGGNGVEALCRKPS
jgi:2-polyprenyl-3-methyl-5-hydroxy-6-metoxy-1,4-benzoquinol methylase